MIRLSLFLVIAQLSVNQLSAQYWDTTWVVESNKFEFHAQHFSPSHSFLSLKKNGELVFRDSTDYAGPRESGVFTDFNSDGHPDFLMHWIGQSPYDRLYLYDKNSQSYYNVKGFKEERSAQALKQHKDLYFSYSKAGCADNNWYSYLFKIEDKAVKRLGTIWGNGCLEEIDDWYIEIRKNGEEQDFRVVDTYPFDTLKTFNQYKWEFIEKYWEQYAQKFK